VSPGGHSAKRTLSSAKSRALDKEYFKIKKNLCQVPDHGHSAKIAYIASVVTHYSLTLSYRVVKPPPLRPRPATPLLWVAVAPAPRRRALALARAPRPRPRRPAAAPSLPATSAAAVPSLPSPAAPHRRALARPPCRPPRTRPPAAKVHAGKVYAADLKPPRPVVSPVTRRLARDQTSKVIACFRFVIL
jgi:hypothetical protein